MLQSVSCWLPRAHGYGGEPLLRRTARVTVDGGHGAILAESGAIAGELGAQAIQLPCPSEVRLATAQPEVLDREFAFAWLRKQL